ncbi:MAG: glycosyltransferase family 4 protein [Anaerolineae bacterium]|nr:glycosyltransferase family 4 protein [Anaerolineae bacterium]MDW8173939.1 glycosyltransferase family 1 protein [Anaerolineae bacterium]
MHLAIDASRATAARSTGTEHYARALIRALILYNDQATQPMRLTLYFRDDPSPDLFPPSPCAEQRVIRLARLWTHLGLAQAIAQQRHDVLFVPAHTLPFIFPGTGAVTVHDLGYRYFPEAHPASQRAYLELTTRHSARRASLIFADSRATADDLQYFYGTPAAKIRVLYPGVDSPPSELIYGWRVALVRARYKLPKRYFLHLGTLQPRKNIDRLIQAYSLWRARRPQHRDVGLVLAGGRGWLYDPAWGRAEGVQEIGYVLETDKPALLRSALALLMPSLYEGFGFPLLEAMHVGTPTLAANTSSLPELAGSASLLVDPLDVEAIADGMARLVDDEALRSDLEARGRQQVKHFTWERAAAQAWEALSALA